MAVALSPIPIIGVILMLGTPRARTNGPAFALGWVGGLTAVSAVVLLVAGGADDPDSATSTGVDGLQLVLGLLFLVMAARQWRKRPAKGEEATMPGWMSSVEHFTPAKSLGLGLALSAANPKNLALVLAGAVALASGTPSGGTMFEPKATRPVTSPAAEVADRAAGVDRREVDRLRPGERGTVDGGLQSTALQPQHADVGDDRDHREHDDDHPDHQRQHGSAVVEGDAPHGALR